MDYLARPGDGQPSTATDVVIPARNESATLGAVIDAFRGARGTGQIIVVNDHSSDQTAQIARDHGARVVSGPGVGKGEAMQTGMFHVNTSRVVFADADLSGFSKNHAQALLNLNPWGMTVGYRDKGRGGNAFNVTTGLPPIAGERAIPSSLARSLALHGYLAEMQINAAAIRRGIPIVHFIMAGVTARVTAGPLRMIDVLPALRDPALLKYQAKWIPPVR